MRFVVRTPQHRNCPLVDRHDLDLKRLKEKGLAFDDDAVVVEVSYSQKRNTIRNHFQSATASGRGSQLFDNDQEPVSPQP